MQGGSLKRELKRKWGEGSGLPVRSLCEKNA